ncbi:hypothetical protein BC830DRAFT_1166353 [Chytriomyces sp. MP71]|nr:hypothetical protein BC830DRAFT_1166353 [Chytriomyces sp. MP71]
MSVSASATAALTSIGSSEGSPNVSADFTKTKRPPGSVSTLIDASGTAFSAPFVYVVNSTPVSVHTNVTLPPNGQVDEQKRTNAKD